MTSLKVDLLYILKSDYSNICGKTYQMSTDAVFIEKKEDGSYILYPGAVTIDKVRIENIDIMTEEKVGNYVAIKLCDIVLQYQSRVQFGIFYDKGE